jgi:hypothetical protein
MKYRMGTGALECRMWRAANHVGVSVSMAFVHGPARYSRSPPAVCDTGCFGYWHSAEGVTAVGDIPRRRFPWCATTGRLPEHSQGCTVIEIRPGVEHKVGLWRRLGLVHSSRLGASARGASLSTGSGAGDSLGRGSFWLIFALSSGSFAAWPVRGKSR